MRSGPSSTAATAYGSKGSGATYGGGGAKQLFVYDQTIPRFESSTSSRSRLSHFGFGQ